MACRRKLYKLEGLRNCVYKLSRKRKLLAARRRRMRWRGALARWQPAVAGGSQLAKQLSSRKPLKIRREMKPLQWLSRESSENVAQEKTKRREKKQSKRKYSNKMSIINEMKYISNLKMKKKRNISGRREVSWLSDERKWKRKWKAKTVIEMLKASKLQENERRESRKHASETHQCRRSAAAIEACETMAGEGTRQKTSSLA